MGDDFFNGMFPFVDVDNGGSVQGLIKDVDTMVAHIDDAKVIPGHGPLGDKKALTAFAEMLARHLERRRRRREGRQDRRSAQDGEGPRQVGRSLGQGLHQD